MNDLLLLLGVAFALDLLIGDPHSPLHPVALFGNYAAKVEAFARRRFGSTVGAGFLGWSLAALPPALFAAGSVLLVRRGFGPHAAAAAAGVWLYMTIALRSLVQHAEAIRRPLAADDLVSARHALSMIVSRDTAGLDQSEIVRGGIESIAENLIDAVTSALFWAVAGYLAGGAAGAAGAAVLLRAVNTLDAGWGYKNEHYLTFGRAAARIDDAAHFIPARLTVPAIALAALLLRGSFGRTFLTALRHRHDHPSPNSCYGMAGFAGALRIRLGGPTVYDGVTEPYPYWGDGRAELTPDDLCRAELLAVAATLFFTLILLAITEVLWIQS